MRGSFYRWPTWGLFSTSDALAAGLTKRALARMADDGQLIHLGRGLVCLPAVVAMPDSLS